MNTNWLTLSKERRIEILNQATELTGLPAIAIEKDWWVSLCLNASFSLPYSKHIVFKGGTSLSKGWDLIERFSEDIDLAMTKGVNYPKGLLAWADEIGIENVLNQLENLQTEYGEDRYRPSPLLKRMVRENKTFY